MELALQDNSLSPTGIVRRIFLAIYSFAALPFAKKRSEAKTDSQEQYLRVIMDKYGSRLLRLAYSYLHNMQDSEEILQDALMKLLDKAPVFESDEHEKAWLMRVTANLSKNRIEYNKLRAADELKDELVAEERQDLSFVWDAVKELPENYREVIHLFYE